MIQSLGPTPPPAADAGPSEVPDVFQEATGADGDCGLLPADSELVSGPWPDSVGMWQGPHGGGSFWGSAEGLSDPRL